MTTTVARKEALVTNTKNKPINRRQLWRTKFCEIKWWRVKLANYSKKKLRNNRKPILEDTFIINVPIGTKFLGENSLTVPNITIFGLEASSGTVNEQGQLDNIIDLVLQRLTYVHLNIS